MYFTSVRLNCLSLGRLVPESLVHVVLHCPLGATRRAAWARQLQPGVVLPPQGDAEWMAAALDLSEGKHSGVAGGRHSLDFLHAVWSARGEFVRALEALR